MSWTAVRNGKYEGKTLPQIIFLDPDHFFWAVEIDIFKNNKTLASEAKKLNYKARNIRIPEGIKAEYWIHRPTGKFDHMDLIPEDRPHQSWTYSRGGVKISKPLKIKRTFIQRRNL
jgi:hypothetical protein